MTIHTTLAAGEIRHDHDFLFRTKATEQHHVRTLQAIISRGTKIDPLLVWREAGEDGPTGRFILLDGRHRLAAFLNLKKTQSIPVVIFDGSRAEAMEAALQANAMAKLPLTTSERTNAAWRLVWDHGHELSIKRTAQAAGVSVRLVSLMRVRAKEMEAAGADCTGSWARDRRGAGEQGDYTTMTDGQRRRAVKDLAKAMREAAGMWPKKDRELFADALAEAHGRYLKEAAEYLYGQGEGEDFYAEPVGSPDVEPELVRELEDVNTDF